MLLANRCSFYVVQKSILVILLLTKEIASRSSSLPNPRNEENVQRQLKLSKAIFIENAAENVAENAPCRLGSFAEPAFDPAKYLDCDVDFRNKSEGIWILKSCQPQNETYFYAATRTCKSKKFVRRQQRLCQSTPTLPFCNFRPQIWSPQVVCNDCETKCTSCQGKEDIMQPTAALIPQFICPLELIANQPKAGGLCNWFTAQLAPDMLNIQYFLQCRPIPSSIVCGVWTLMPCSPGTVFDPLMQVCVHDPGWDGASTSWCVSTIRLQCVHDIGRILALEMKQGFPPLLVPPAISEAARPTPDAPALWLLAPCECGCQVGAAVGRCDEHLQCPTSSRTICQTFPTGACRNGDAPGQVSCFPTCCA